MENLSKINITIEDNLPNDLYTLNFLSNKLLKFSNNLSFSGITNFEINCKNGTFFMRISKTRSFYIFEVFIQISKYFIGTWYEGARLVFTQIS